MRFVVIGYMANAKKDLADAKYHPAAPDKQLTFINRFFQSDTDNSITFDLDLLLPIKLGLKREVDTPDPIIREIDIKIAGEKVRLSVSRTPATIVKGGKGKLIFPGIRDKWLELAIRKLAVQQVASTELKLDDSLEIQITLYDLNKELRFVGHGMTWAQMKESLMVLAGSFFIFQIKRIPFF